MATIEFSMIITDEAVTYAREAQVNPGWYLTPLKWAISEQQGELSVTRTTDSMFAAWVSQPFSGVHATGTNKLLHSVVVPPNAYHTEMVIGEIYFIYKDYYGNEFLYAIAQPTSNIVFSPGVYQSYSFVFSLNNTEVSDIYTIDYTYPQDIEDHNQDPNAHDDHLLARNGSRLATGILRYDKKLTYSTNRDIVDKEYVDKITDVLENDINTMYCPPGAMMWWPKISPPKGWFKRDGGAYSKYDYPELFKALGTTYGSGNGSTTHFNVPDDMTKGLFIRSYSTTSGLTANFGQVQSGGLPNITGGFGGGNVLFADQTYANGCFSIDKSDTVGGSRGTKWAYKGINLNASKSSSLYGAAKEVRPVNRCYLPIIKY